MNHLLQEKPVFIRKVGPLIASLHVADYDAIDERN
jgi:hypothetical protein